MRALPVLSIALVLAFLISGLAVIATTDHAEASTLTKFSSELELKRFLWDRAGGSGGDKLVAEANDAAASGSGYSRTNVQVEGVDEGDRVKTNGEMLYIAEGATVHIIRAGPPLADVSDIAVDRPERAFVQGLYLLGDRLTVVYSQYGETSGYPGDGDARYYYPYYQAQRTCVSVYDVSDPESPVLERSTGISGYTVTSRMIGATLYLVTEHSVWSGRDVQFPEVTSGGSSEAVKATEVRYDPAMPSVSSFVNLLAVDVSSGRTGTLSALAGSTSVVYMSPTALYLTMQLWDSGDLGSGSQLTTSIYRIAVSGTDMELEGQASVDGRPLNQFALDESGDRLRIATTTGWPDISNEVHVLDLKLREVGSATGIAPGESIYSCRFMGDRLYLVTFLQIDPLFIVDLSTDTPSVMGELKVPGASNYLQMVDAGLMGIGFENGSVKVSLFNVTDPANMTEIDSFVVEGFSHSPAQYDHRAVLYQPETGTLVIPLITNDWSGWGGAELASYPYRPSSAALVLKLDGNGVREVGRVVHENATVERSLYIGNVLYAVSDTTVTASDMTTLELLDSLTYSDGWSKYYGIDDGIAMPVAGD
ncbi:MAG: beta-propeller domain-containing protein [Methanomassiliicoccus sp.]|nr:beta-propeller domain-containing protein [Methanomassiliicoccus sp.]